VSVLLCVGGKQAMTAAIQPNVIRASVPRALWGILALMVVSVAINYIDRGSLSTAAPLLADDLKIRPAQLGWLLSSFFWTYALGQISSGWLVDRYDVKWVMAIGFLAWSLATAATGLARSFGALLIFRLLLGVGESVAYPCYSKIISAHFPETQRGLANGSIDAGTKLGPALGILAGGTLMARYGWRPVFIVLGLGSLLWLPAWCKWVPRGRDAWQAGDGDGHGFAEIVCQRPFWATFIGHFSGNYFWYFLLTWLPYYLVRERGFSMNKMSGVSAVTYCATGLATIAAGRLADRAIAAGATPTRVRKTCATLGLAFATVVVAVAFVPNSAGAMAILIVSCMSYGVFASSHFAISQTIAGPATAGKWTGMQNCIANMAGIAAPAITGVVVAKTGRFAWAFVVSAAVVLTGAAAYAFLLGPVEPLVWRSREQREGP
jgi:ACS family D-galactonate transporter-like MFS transporter